MDSLISVIIPTYKRPYEILLRAIKSALNQSYSNIELIIVNDSPQDDPNKNEIARKISKIKDSRVRYIQHNCNLGACKARNTGIHNSTGRYIAFLDDDDEWLANKLELQLEKFQDEQIGLVYCDSYTITVKDGTIINKTLRANRVSGWVYDKLILENFIGSTSFVMIKKEVLNSSGLFNINLDSAQDYELWLRISKIYKVDFVDVPLVNYYVHDGERISSNVDKKIQGLVKLIELNTEYLQLHPKTLSIRKLKIVPFYAIKSGNKTALIKWLEAVKIYPFQIENIEYLIKIIIISIRLSKYYYH